MCSIGSIFSGGGLADIGAMQAGLQPIFAIEHDPAIAAVYERNLPGRMIVADVRTVDPTTLPTPTILWASSPCQSYSVARSKSLPPRDDGDLGDEVLRFVRVLLPSAVVVENVPPFAHAPVFQRIVRGLSDLGYTVAYSIVDASDYGVPQSRRRLILRAVRGGLLLPLPPPMRPKIGWFAAIADLIPTLPESKFAPWQLARLGALSSTALVPGGNPPGDGERLAIGTESSAMTVTAGMGGKLPLRAFLVHNQISQAQDAPIVREADEPGGTITTNSNGRLRAFLVDGKDAGERGLPYRDAGTPAQTVVASIGGHEPRAWLDTGRVVKLSPRCLARLMGIPDDYSLPSSNSLAGRVLGNGVCPPVAEMICRNVLEALGGVVPALREGASDGRGRIPTAGGTDSGGGVVH